MIWKTLLKPYVSNPDYETNGCKQRHHLLIRRRNKFIVTFFGVRDKIGGGGGKGVMQVGGFGIEPRTLQLGA